MLTLLIIFSISLLVLVFGFLEIRFPLLASRYRVKFLKLFMPCNDDPLKPGEGREEQDITGH